MIRENRNERNIEILSVEVYKTIHNLNPNMIDEIFKPKQDCYSSRYQDFSYPNLRTVTYGLIAFRYKASRIWAKFPIGIQNADSLLKVILNAFLKSCVIKTHKWRTKSNDTAVPAI